MPDEDIVPAIRRLLLAQAAQTVYRPVVGFLKVPFVNLPHMLPDSVVYKVASRVVDELSYLKEATEGATKSLATSNYPLFESINKLESSLERLKSSSDEQMSSILTMEHDLGNFNLAFKNMFDDFSQRMNSLEKENKELKDRLLKLEEKDQSHPNSGLKQNH